MREEQIFAKTLEELSALAKEQGNMLSEEQVTEAFDKANLNLGEPQLEMIFAYLKNKKIGIGQPADPFDYMTREEIDYLEEYLKAVQAGADVTDGRERSGSFICDGRRCGRKASADRNLSAAGGGDCKALRRTGRFSGRPDWRRQCGADDGGRDAGLCTECKEAEGTIASMIMEAMENYISENASEKKTGEKLAEMPMIFWKKRRNCQRSSAAR